MLDIGWTELLIIAVVAVIVVGPKDLPRMLRSLGQYAGKLKRTAGEFRSQFDEAIRDAELDDLKSSIDEIREMNPAGQIKDAIEETVDPLRETAEEIKSGIESEPAAKSDAANGAALDDADADDDPGAVEDSEPYEPAETAEVEAPTPESDKATAAKSES